MPLNYLQVGPPQYHAPLWLRQQEAGKFYDAGRRWRAARVRAQTHTHESGARGRVRSGLLLLWCNGDCAVGSERGVEWVPSTVEVKQPPTVSPGHRPRDRQQAPRQWRHLILPHYMETHNQVCLLATQLAMSWRLERFLTHLYDVAARRE